MALLILKNSVGEIIGSVKHILNPISRVIQNFITTDSTSNSNQTHTRHTDSRYIALLLYSLAHNP